jgi:hypothetical protein
MEILVMIGIGGFILFIIIVGSVKIAVKEALYEFKEDVVKEFNLKPIRKDTGDNS